MGNGHIARACHGWLTRPSLHVPFVFQCRKMTEEGLEANLAVNYLGNFLLTTQLLPLLKESPDGRILCVNSSLHKKVLYGARGRLGGVRGRWRSETVVVQFVLYNDAPTFGKTNLRVAWPTNAQNITSIKWEREGDGNVSFSRRGQGRTGQDHQESTGTQSLLTRRSVGRFR